MAQYTVTYKCGHKANVNLFGAMAERERKINWMEQTCDCPECKKAAEANAAIAKAAELNLPALTGSEKQIAWAMTIRNKMLAYTEGGKSVEAGIATYRSLPAAMAGQFEALRKQRRYFELVARCATETSAAWFIDNRDF